MIRKGLIWKRGSGFWKRGTLDPLRWSCSTCSQLSPTRSYLTHRFKTNKKPLKSENLSLIIREYGDTVYDSMIRMSDTKEIFVNECSRKLLFRGLSGDVFVWSRLIFGFSSEYSNRRLSIGCQMWKEFQIGISTV